MKLHTGDTVVVITGKDKGKTGTILRVLPLENRVVIGGINMRTRHVKKTPQQAGRKVRFEASMHVSNVMILDPKTKKRSRIGYKMEKNGNKTRISKISGEMVVKVKPKAEKKTVKKSDETPKKKDAEKSSEEPGTSPVKGQPFWKRMGFGAGAMEELANTPEEAHSKKDQSIPDQQIHKRGGSRGS